MKKEVFHNSTEKKIVGLSVRTSNMQEFNPETNTIGKLITRYWQENMASTIKNRTNPGVTLAIYTDYESNEHGDYTYFFGEEVSEIDIEGTEFKACVIPAGKFMKFTTEVGKMPEVVINAWMDIWDMSNDDFDGERAYIADFEIYDKRAIDPNATSMDICIGIKE